MANMTTQEILQGIKDWAAPKVIYDISAAHNNTKYADLSDALGTNGGNIPQEYRKGGITVRYVRTSDNKYVQYRLMTNAFTTDVTQWAICNDSVLVECPEYVAVYTDADGKIIIAVENDGNIHYGAGVPRQVIDYITAKIAELSLDEYEDIVTFLGSLIEGDKTLAQLLDEKVDKVERKSLIDAEYAGGISYVENPEFAAVWLDNEERILFGVQTNGNFLFGYGVPRQVKEYIEQKIEELPLESIVNFIGEYLNNTTLEELLSKKVDGEYVDNPEFIEAKVDAEDKVLEGIQKDGTKVIGGDLKVLGNMEVFGVSYKVIENPEYLAAWLDAEEKVIFGFKTDGKTYVGDADFLNDIKNNKEAISEINAIIASISSTIEPLDIDALTSITATENPEFIEVELDADDKIIGGRKSDGKKFENIGFETTNISIDGMYIENIDDQEDRMDIGLDADNKIIHYRDKAGVLHENIGIETPIVKTNSLNLSELGIVKLHQDLKNVEVEEVKQYVTDYPINIPKYGRINIITTPTEASLVNVEGYTDYSFRCLVNGTTNKPVSINGGTPSFSPDWEQIEYNADYDTWEQKPARNPDVTGYHRYADKMYHEENGTIVYDWSEDKFKHQCTVEVDFPGFLSGTFYALVSFQGNTTMFLYKKSFRITFYKASDYKKKKKFKIGDMVELSGFNTKAYYNDRTRIKEPVLYRIATLFWENRDYKDQYPWNNTVGMFTGATGTVKNFPIVVYVDGEFYGLEFFGEKKDENNYMLNDDADGMFVQGQGNTTDFWRDYNITTRWEDQMNDELTQSNIDAISAFLHYINDSFDAATVEEHFSKKDWIDYIIFVQVFSLGDNLGNNVVLYTKSDKTKFYPFLYDVDNAFERPGQNIFYNNPHNFDRTFWDKLINVWWDDIVDRYKELREAVLTPETFTKIVMSISRAINQSDYEDEISQWGRDGVDYSGATKSLIDNFNASIRYFDLYYKK